MEELSTYLLILIDQIEEKLAGTREEDVFYSNYGLNFQDQYLQLLDSVTVGSLLPSIIRFTPLIDSIIADPSKIKSYLKEILEFSVRQANISKAKKNEARMISGEIEQYIEHLMILGKKELNKLQRLSDKLNKILGEQNLEPSKESEENTQITSVTTFMEQVDVVGRINAYFVFSLYALIDFYCMGLLVDIISLTPQEKANETFQQIKQNSPHSNPVNSMGWILNRLEKYHPGIKKTITQVSKRKRWQHHFKTFNTLKDTRDPIAHRIPIISLEKIRKNFSQYYKSVTKQLQELNTEFKKQAFPSFFENTLTSVFIDFELAFYLREIGMGCFRYLALMEGLIYYLKSEI